jgi:hypothetical protein
MTQDEFRENYTLLDGAPVGAVATRRAIRVATGESVLVHDLGPAGAAGARKVLDRIQTLPPSDRSAVVDVVEVDRRATLITRTIAGFHSLGEWLDSEAPPSDAWGPTEGTPQGTPSGASQPPPTPRGGGPQSGGASSTGDFTALFGSAPEPAPDRTVGRADAPPGGGDRPGRLGGFTELFQPAPDQPRASASAPADHAAGHLKIRVKRSPADSPPAVGPERPPRGATSPPAPSTPRAAAGSPRAPAPPVRGKKAGDETHGSPEPRTLQSLEGRSRRLVILSAGAAALLVAAALVALFR